MNSSRQATGHQADGIAIIGMGCLFPGARNLTEFWRSICRGEDGITEVPDSHWRPDDYYDPDPKQPDMTYCHRGGFLPPVPFDPTEFGIPPTILEATDTTQLLSLVIAKAALEDAGYGENRDFNRDTVSVIIGVTGTQELVLPLSARLGHPGWRRALEAEGLPPDQAERIIQRISETYVGWQENSFPGLLGNVVAGRIANRLNLRGTNCVVDAACASSLGAIHLAMLELAAGRSDMALAGGADTLNDIFMYMCFSKTPALSPTGDARPFSNEADGTVLGEGVGLVVLKRLADAERDGDRIYAVLKGIGTSSDGRSQSIYAPHAAGQARALREAYQQAGFSPATVGLIEAHGTGTQVGDATEFDALQAVFREARGQDQWCALGAIKSQIGHTKAAAGIAGLIKAALAIHHKSLPPTIKIKRPNAAMNIDKSPFYLSTELRPWPAKSDQPRRAGVSAFGFGGSNFHAVLEEHQASLPAVCWNGTIQIIALSAQSRRALKSQLDLWHQRVCDPNFDRDRLAYHAAESRRSFSNKHSARLLIVVNLQDQSKRPERDTQNFDPTRSNLKSMLERAIAGLDESQNSKKLSSPDVHLGNGPPSGPLAFLFPGQGSQYLKMGCELACTFPEVLDAFAAAEQAGDNDPLCDLIFPRPSFDPQQLSNHSQVLMRTEVAQRAIGALSLGMLRVLQRFGIKPEMTAGHSYGELPALAAAGRMNEATLHRLTRLRGRLMAEGDEDRGTMLAVRAKPDDLQQMIEQEALDLVIANRNSPSQQILSGSRLSIGQAAEFCKGRGWAVKPLPVSGAFHSPYMEVALQPFRNALETIDFHPGTLPVFANATSLAYPQEVIETRRLLAEQLISPVDFVALIQNMYLAGARTFVEVGPRKVLCGLVKDILADQPHQAWAMDATSGQGNAMLDLARLLSRLAAEGHVVDLTKWERPVAEPRTPRMVIPLTGKNYRSPKSNQPAEQRTKPNKLPVFAHVDHPMDSKLSDPQTTPQAPEPRALCEARADNRMDPKLPDPQSVPTPQPSDSVSTPPATDPPTRRQTLSADEPTPMSPSARLFQQGLQAMQRLQQQTAEAHQRFLEGQEQAHQTLQHLLEHQQQLLGTSMGEVANRVDAPIGESHRSADESSTSIPSQRQEDHASLETQQLAASLPDVQFAVQQSDSSEGLHDSQIEKLDSPIPTARSEEAAKTEPGPDGKAVESLVIHVVCEKTGYPAEMIDLDMDLEADLGVDSIKRVEIVAALEERIPAFQGVNPEYMGSIRSLRQIVDFILSGIEETVSQDSDSTSPTAEQMTDPTPAAGGITADTFAKALLEVVAELTGYPMEMLELDMDLEADLGIDSIKRVEILAAIEGRIPDLPPVQPEYMGSLRTLRQIVTYCTGRQQDDTEKAQEPTQEVDTSCSIPGADEPQTFDGPDEADDLHRRVLEAVDLPEPSPNQWAIAADHEIWVTDDGSGLADAIVGRLQEIGQSARLIRPDADIKLDGAFIAGLIHVAPLPETLLMGSDGCDWSPATEVMLKTAFAMTQAAGPSLQQAARQGGALLATVSRMDGAFGLVGGDFDPAQGGLAGLVKTAALEWPQVHCQALDVSCKWQDHPTAAAAIVRELQSAGPIEVGLDGQMRRGLVMVPTVITDQRPTLSAGDVVVISGGARGVTFQAALALARRYQPALVLLGRTRLDEQEPDWLGGLEQEREIKAAIRSNAFAKGTKPAPKEFKRLFKYYMAQREIRDNLDCLSAAGSPVRYISVDVCDDSAVRAVLADVQSNQGPIRGLIHGAGVIHDSLLLNKTQEQFDRVFDTKVHGLRSLLNAIDLTALRHIVLFSSVSGRCGNQGQVDYAMANEVLNKVAHRLAARLPDCQVVSLNWGPWDGGMVHPILRREFRNHGIQLIPLETGGRCVADEVANASAGQTEVILGATLDQAESVDSPQQASSQNATAAKSFSLAFEHLLDLEAHPFLRSHVIDSRPVLPTAMIAEWLGHAALHANPGLVLRGLDELRIFKGVVLNGQPLSLRFLTAPPQRSGEVFDVNVELRTNGRNNHDVLHAGATVVLSSQPAAAPSFDLPQGLTDRSYDRDMDAAYRDILFHGEHLRCIQRIIGLSDRGLVAEVRATSRPSAWMSEPLRSSWLTNPLAMDSAFQLAILWCHAEMGAVCLPSYVHRFRHYRPGPEDCLTIVMQVRRREPRKIISDFVFQAPNGDLVARIEGYEATVDASLMAAFRRSVQLDAPSS